MKIKTLQPFHNYLIAFLVSTLTFALTVLLLDRDLMRYPVVGSGKGEKREKAIVVETISTYNKILSDFYASGGVPALLNEFPATKAMRHGVFRDIGFIRDTGRVLVYDMADMTPVDVQITSFNTAEAVVFEEWNYLYQNSSDRRPVTSIKGMGQGFRYRLVRQDGIWMVSAWDPVEIRDPGEKGFLF